MSEEHWIIVRDSWSIRFVNTNRPVIRKAWRAEKQADQWIIHYKTMGREVHTNLTKAEAKALSKILNATNDNTLKEK